MRSRTSMLYCSSYVLTASLLSINERVDPYSRRMHTQVRVYNICKTKLMNFRKVMLEVIIPAFLAK